MFRAQWGEINDETCPKFGFGWLLIYTVFIKKNWKGIDELIIILNWDFSFSCSWDFNCAQFWSACQVVIYQFNTSPVLKLSVTDKYRVKLWCQMRERTLIKFRLHQMLPTYIIGGAVTQLNMKILIIGVINKFFILSCQLYSIYCKTRNVGSYYIWRFWKYHNLVKI